MKILERLQIALLFLLSIMLVGGTSIVTGEMGWDTFKDTWFYVEQVTTDVAIICVTLGTVYMYLDWFKENNKQYIDCANYINEFATSARNIPSILLNFLDYFNRKRKIAQYKFNIGVKLAKLEFITIINLKFWVLKKRRFKEEEMHLWNIGTEEQKANSKYCRKRKMYEEQLDEKLIDKIIDTTPVKYDRVTMGTLLSEYYTDEEASGPNEFVEKKETQKILNYRIPKLLFSFGLTFMFSSIIFGPAVFNTAGLMKLFVKLFVLAFNMWSSILYAKKHANKITLHNALFKKGVLMEYEKWAKQEAAKTTDNQKSLTGGTDSNE